jgi:hypothetical protein
MTASSMAMCVIGPNFSTDGARRRLAVSRRNEREPTASTVSSGEM